MKRFLIACALVFVGLPAMAEGYVVTPAEGYNEGPSEDCIRCYRSYIQSDPDAPMLVLIPGGSWTADGRHSSPRVNELATFLADVGYNVVVAGYRLLKPHNITRAQPALHPRTHVPHMQFIINDLKRMVQAVRHRYNPSQLVLIGHSAGGHLAATLLIQEVEADGLAVLGGHMFDMKQSLIERPGWLNGWQNYYNLQAQDFLLYSPALRVRDDHPPTFIVSSAPGNGVADWLRTQSLLFRDALDAKGIDVEEHTFPIEHGATVFGHSKDPVKIQDYLRPWLLNLTGY